MDFKNLKLGQKVKINPRITSDYNWFSIRNVPKSYFKEAGIVKYLSSDTRITVKFSDGECITFESRNLLAYKKKIG